MSQSDFNDLAQAQGGEQGVRKIIDDAREKAKAIRVDAKPGDKKTKRTLIALDYQSLMKIELPPREPILGAWCMEQSINMVYGPRGVGKSHFSFGVAFAVSTATEFLGWKAPKPRRVLFIDGELPASVVQERLRAIERATGVRPEPGMLRICTPDILGRAAPDLGMIADQEEIDDLAREFGADLIVLDNLSCLLRSGAAENDAESWVNVSTWALMHRAAHRSILIVHHAGKNGGQRGTSRREDLLDVVVALKKPSEYSPEDGARFEIHFEKARHLFGPDVEPFEARLTTDQEGVQSWQTTNIEGRTDEKIIDLLALGLSLTDIAKEIGCNKSTVSRHVQQLRERGVLPADGSKPRNTTRNTRQKGIEGLQP